MTRKKLNPAEVVTLELGVRPLARELGLDPKAVMRWKESGYVPSQYHVDVLLIAQRQGKVITTQELIYGR